mmetsp:Transcript_33091/g.104118  ORF Transcript_33091/g.104118 Transcript_33091/m.104118 type:complete len:305 (+) Transcript_33091:1006-1920(+)
MVWCASASANCASRAKERDSTEEEEAADRSLSALERCGGSSASSAAGKSALQSTFRRAEDPPIPFSLFSLCSPLFSSLVAKHPRQPEPRAEAQEARRRGRLGTSPHALASGRLRSWAQSRLAISGAISAGGPHDVGGEARLGAIAVDDPNARRSSAALARLPGLLGDLDSRDGHAGSHPHADLLALLEKPPPHTPEPAPRIANAIRRGVQLHRLQQRDDARLAETSPRSAGIGPPSPAAARRLRAPRMATGRRTGPGRRAARGPCPRLGSSGGAAACAIGPRAGWRGSCGAPTSQRRAGRTRPS